MPVELEEIALLGLFTLNNRTIQIKEEHFSNINSILKDLKPIRIESQKLQRPGFLRYPGGIYHRKHGTCEFVLRPTKSGRWEFAIDSGQPIRVVTYIHQIQRLYFDLFEDHLFISRIAGQ